MLRVAVVSSSLSAVAGEPLVKKTMPVSGLTCNGNQTAWVLYPDDGEKYPLVSFAHGLNAWNVPEWFPYLMETIAKSGYVVVASEAGTGWCSTETTDQIRCLQWALQSSELRPHIDTSPGTGIAGHSMGGGATITSASDAAGIAAHDIKVAVAMHPAAGNPNKPEIPILYLTGTTDNVVSAASVLKQYNAAKNVYKTFANVKGAYHTDATGCPSGCGNFSKPPFGANTEDDYAVDMLDCFLKDNTDACGRVNSCIVPNAVTGASLPVSECHHNPGTAEEQFV